MLAYGTSTDAQDEYLRISEIVTRDSLIHFLEGVISCFGESTLEGQTKMIWQDYFMSGRNMDFHV